jgi:hypothetical protein
MESSYTRTVTMRLQTPLFRRGALSWLRPVVCAVVCAAFLAGCAAMGPERRADACGGIEGQWATWDLFLKSQNRMRVIRLANEDVGTFVDAFNKSYDTSFRPEGVYFAYKPSDRIWLMTFVSGPCVDMTARIPRREVHSLMQVSGPSI